MGSIDRACISGFLCRLCSEMHRIVIHIYGDQGKKLGLVEKINGYLPITISPTDPLPKTICESCLRRVEQHYDLLMRLSRIREERFLRVNKRRTILDTIDVSSPEISEEEVYNNTDEYNSISSILPTTVSAASSPDTTVEIQPQNTEEESPI
ncbi:uncharacterized protein LOC119683871 [Teleopsis dalmanni]|uniref:uncharacterized protein LOC119683871 n=1 Tax=Teleopsis dalmanni TaxID=139649 RepID=UPI0018CDB9DA|nr:uncharacterized protein LOC119683871 [Teleopsis dalmanni]